MAGRSKGFTRFTIETVDGKHLLLRVADSSEYSQKRTEFEFMKHLVTLGVPMPLPIDFGTYDNGKCVYTLLSWIDGAEVEAILPNLSKREQYMLGIESGKILQKIHAIPSTDITDNWGHRYYNVINP